MSDFVLFGLSADEFTNNGAVGLARRLREAPDQYGETLPIRFETDRIVLDTDEAGGVDEKTFEHIRSTLHSEVKRVTSTTHQRTAAAYRLNQELRNHGYGSDHPAWIPAPSRPFPEKYDAIEPYYPEISRNDADASNYPNGEITTDLFREDDERDDNGALIPFSSDGVLFEGNGSNVYKMRSTYVGNRSINDYTGMVEELSAYVDQYVDDLAAASGSDDHSNVRPCMACGSEVFVTGKIDQEGHSDDVRYNQSFAVRATESGIPQPLGQSALGSVHKGRCVACVAAGWYHTHAAKPVFSLDGIYTVRVVAPVGGFERLNEIHALMDEHVVGSDAMSPYDDLHTTISEIQTDSTWFQLLAFYGAMLRELSERVGTTPWDVRAGERIPTATSHYVASTTGPPAYSRQIGSFGSVEPGTWIYDLLKYQRVEDDPLYDPSPWEDEVKGYWPLDVLQWYATVDLGGEASIEYEKDRLVRGLVERQPGEVADAIAEIYTRTLTDDDPRMDRFEEATLRHYIDTMLNHMISGSNGRNGDEQLDEETRDSIYQVGATIGRAFGSPDGIGVLTRLQNASTRSGFEEALSRVAEMLHKRRLKAETERRDGDDEPAADFYSSYRDEDVDRVFDALLTGDWQSVKQILVAHAFLSAQSNYSYGEWKRRDEANSADSASVEDN